MCCSTAIEVLDMTPHQQQVIDEKAELDEKRTKLATFREGELFASLPAEEQERLIRQHSCMTEYSEILGERIAAF
jgi:hypothetical protein